MSFSIRLSEEERLLADSYARMHALSLAEAFKSALFEKIEDEYDISLAKESYDKYKTDGNSRPAKEFWEELGL